MERDNTRHTKDDPIITVEGEGAGEVTGRSFDPRREQAASGDKTSPCEKWGHHPKTYKHHYGAEREVTPRVCRFCGMPY